MHNSFGEFFRITTFGESHGPGIGVVIDGCPAGLPLKKEEIDAALARRSPGKTPYTSPRKESDAVQILSGHFRDQTTGAPLALWIENKDADSSAYASLEKTLRPGHAHYTYLQKYKIFDHRGGGRASARETAARVAAGFVAQKLLYALHGTEVIAFLSSVGPVQLLDPFAWAEQDTLKEALSPLFCPDPTTSLQMEKALREIQEEGDSWGGSVSCIARPLPPGLGDPVYRKLEALLAFAMLSLPASKGFEIGSGFRAAEKKGSEHNDAFTLDAAGKPALKTNFAGGTLGGISTGEPLFFQVAFKPTSSIRKPQESVTLAGEKTELRLDEKARHDPCVAIRAVPVVEAMAALVLADAALSHKISSCLFPSPYI